MSIWRILDELPEEEGRPRRRTLAEGLMSRPQARWIQHALGVLGHLIDKPTPAVNHPRVT